MNNLINNPKKESFIKTLETAYLKCYNLIPELICKTYSNNDLDSFPIKKFILPLKNIYSKTNILEKRIEFISKYLYDNFEIISDFYDLINRPDRKNFLDGLELIIKGKFSNLKIVRAIESAFPYLSDLDYFPIKDLIPELKNCYQDFSKSIKILELLNSKPKDYFSKKL